jgi:hypothetical protein
VATKYDLETWLLEAIRDLGERIWRDHEDELRRSGDLFYTWQYDIRWAAQRLRDQRVLLPNSETERGIWQLATGV